MKVLKKMACFEACKQLHRIGALTDHLVPLFVEDENSSSDESGENFVTFLVNANRVYLIWNLLFEHF